MGYPQAVEFAIKNGFQGVEIWSNSFEFWPRTVTEKEIEAIKSIANGGNISLAIHFCLENNNLGDINEGHIVETMKQLKETIQLSQKMGAGIVVIHPALIPHMFITHEDKYLNPTFALTNLKQEVTRRFKKSLAEAALFAEDYQVVIGVENLNHIPNCIQSTLEDLVEWVDQISSPSLQITLDVGHANIVGGVERAFKIFGSRIKHIHLDDNDGKTSNHGELGTGTINWDAISPFLKSFNGMLSLEVLVSNDVVGAVLRSKSFIEKLIK
jgi:sugar phosphate isomerase/epimerase